MNYSSETAVGDDYAILFADLGGAFKMPTRAHDDDAGFDLYCAYDTEIEPGEFVDVQTRTACQLPPLCWGMLTGRSSSLRKHGLLVNQGVIDNGYRGELFAGVFNLTRETVVVKQGWRIAQLIPIPQVITKRTWPIGQFDVSADTLEWTPRDTNGFGSTGE